VPWFIFDVFAFDCDEFVVAVEDDDDDDEVVLFDEACDVTVDKLDDILKFFFCVV